MKNKCLLLLSLVIASTLIFSAINAQSVSLTSDATQVCAGTPITFTATPSDLGSADAQYIWQVSRDGGYTFNNIAYTYSNNTYTASNVSNNDIIRVDLSYYDFFNDNFGEAYSNNIQLTINETAAGINTISSNTTKGSLVFNGTNYLTMNHGFTLGAGAFTVECWFRMNSIPNEDGVIVGNNSLTQAATLYILNNHQIKMDYNGYWSRTFEVATMTTGKWYHLALCRNASKLETLFLNGVGVSSFDFGANDDANYTTSTFVGRWNEANKIWVILNLV